MIVFKELGNLGRLGNQLFQISATIQHAQDRGVYPAFPKWKYADKFPNFSYPEISLEYDQKFGGIDHEIHHHAPFHYEPINNSNPNIVLSGYFQSEKYFAGVTDQVAKIFTPSDDILERVKGLQMGDMTEWCAVHVRRTDYLEKSDYHHNQDHFYYREAIRKMEAQRGVKKFVFFSDDPTWCFENFDEDKFPDLSFVVSFCDDEVIDLFLMASCGFHIIANSSYSWWGSWLSRLFPRNRKEDPLTIAPKTWFGSASNDNWKDIYQPDWMII